MARQLRAQEEEDSDGLLVQVRNELGRERGRRALVIYDSENISDVFGRKRD